MGSDGMPAALVDGLAEKPYQLRAIAPLIVRWLTPWLPGALVQTAAANPALGPTIDQLAPGRPALGLAALGVMYISLLGSLVALIRLSADLGFNQLQQWTAALGLLSGLMLLFAPAAYVYDLPTLALFTWCLVWIQRGNYKAYLITFALTTLSKETGLLLIPIYWLHSDRSREAVERSGEQLGIWGIGRVILLWTYRYNGGGLFELHIQDMIYWASLPSLWAFVGLLLIAVSLAVWGWSHKPLFLRQAVLSTLPAFLGLYVFFGYPGELRVFLEVAPVILLLLFRQREVQTNAGIRPVLHRGIFGAYRDHGGSDAAGR